MPVLAFEWPLKAREGQDNALRRVSRWAGTRSSPAFLTTFLISWGKGMLWAFGRHQRRAMRKSNDALALIKKSTTLIAMSMPMSTF